jgi:hypothetical protein
VIFYNEIPLIIPHMSDRVKYKFTLKCAKMCTDRPAINNVFQKLMYDLLEANRAYYCPLFDPHPSTLSPSSFHSLALILILFGPPHRSWIKE